MNRVTTIRTVGRVVFCLSLPSLLCLTTVTLNSSSGHADNVEVHHLEGISHGFLVLHSLDGKALAAGDLIQSVRGTQVTTQLTFHFKDGSLHDETTVFTQDGSFRLIFDHLIQKGPSFPHPIDILIDATRNTITIHADDNGKEKDHSEQIDLPSDLANGMLLVLLRNISASTPETKVSMLSTPAKPRLLKLSIIPKGVRTFAFAGQRRKATHFEIKIEIGGIAGVVAPMVGKQPPDVHFWISQGASPTFIRSEAALYESGPIWRTDLASLSVADHDAPPSTPGQHEDKKKK